MKKLKFLLIGLLFTVGSLFCGYLREEKAKEVDKGRINIHEITNSGAKASDVSVLVNASFIAGPLATYENNDSNSFFVVFDSNKQYIVYLNNQDAKEKYDYLIDHPDETITINGVTKLIPETMEEYGKVFVKDWLDNVHNHNEEEKVDHTHDITTEEFYEYFGYVYVDATISRYSNYQFINILIIILAFLGLGFLITRIYNLVINKRK